MLGRGNLMRYVISDIHGHYDLFRVLMDKIGFSERDELYVCGDVLDEGANGVKLLRWLADTTNAWMIRGNHEEAFLSYYASLMRECDDYGAVLERMREYFGEDGRYLTWELIDYLEGLPYYIEEDDFICVHAGVSMLDNGEISLLSQVPIETLLYDRRFRNPDALPKKSKCVFFGHTSLDNPKIRVYSRTKNPKSIADIIKVHLDVGTFTSGVLGCFRIDDCTAYYVTKNDLTM